MIEDWQPTPYIERMSSIRAQRLTQEEATEGITCLSAETCPEQLEHTVRTFAEEHFAEFLVLINKVLPRTEQDMVISYYLLGKAQAEIGRIFSTSQTQTSQRLIRSMRALSALLIFPDPVKALPGILRKNGLEDAYDGHIMEAINLYLVYKRFDIIAPRLHEYYPSRISNTFKYVIRKLEEAKDKETLAIGAWLRLLVLDFSSEEMPGRQSRKERERQTSLASDPDGLGSFVCDVTSPGFDAMFAARAEV